jgi:RNA polymerase sigma-54 factor
LSDPDIVKQLKRQGLHIARRTVTKYRHALRIPPATGRRHGAQAGA